MKKYIVDAGPVFFLAAVGASFLAGCVEPRVAVKPGFDFSKIKSLAVFEGQSRDERGVVDELVRRLLTRGYSVRVVAPEKAAGSDAFLRVNVTRLTPDKKYLIHMNRDDRGKHRDTIVVNPVTEIGGRSIYPSATAAGLDDAGVFVSNATVGLSARLSDPKSGEILWAASVSYEGLDLDSAVDGAAASLVKKIPVR